MRRFWVIAPFWAKNPDVWEKVWRYDLRHGIISIGWRDIGSPSGLSEQQLEKRILRTYSQDTPRSAKIGARMLHSFYHGVKPDDMIIARRGVKKLAAVGTVTRAAYYDPSKNLEPFRPNHIDIAYPNHIDVDWAKAPRDKEFSSVAFGQKTIYEIAESRFRGFTEYQPPTRNADTDSVLPEEITHPSGLVEGAVRSITVNAYERNPEARRQCIEAHGTTCCICGFAFGAVYGKAADGYIHVHHLRPLSGVNGEYVVDPVKDLRPVCPNCHAVLHLGGQCRSIQEVSRMVEENRG